MKETWRTVPCLPTYQASNQGRLRHKIFESHGREYGGTIGIGQWDGKRYILRYRGKTYKVARLVCWAFKGAPPSDRPYCIHLDEDSRNNHPGNLEWSTQKKNLNMPKFISYCRGRTGDNNPRRKNLKLRAP